MKKSATAPHEIFNEAMDWFFGHNPKNPYWFLLVLYLRKKHLLSIENNYPGDSINALTPFNEPGYWSDVVGQKFPEGVHWQTVVGQIEGNERLIAIRNEFEQASRDRDNERRSGTLSIFNTYQWEDGFLIETVQMLLKIDDDWIDTNFKSIFSKAISRIFANELYGLYTLPAELTEVIGHLMGAVVGTIYNPFAGVGSFALAANSKAMFIGEEISPILAAIADLRVLAAGLDGHVSTGDSINDKDYNADIIVSTPPFVLDIRDRHIEALYGGRNDAGTFLLRKCAMRRIRGIIVAPMGISFRDGYAKRVREMLLDRDCVDMVIELPSNIFDRSGVLTAIYVINQDHNHKGHVRIINATECYMVDQRKNVIDVASVVSMIENGNNKNSILVDADTIAKNDFSFAFSRYAQNEDCLPDGTPLIPISELGEIVTIRTSSDITRGKFANFSILSNPNKLKIFTADDFEDRELPPSTCQITQDCIIVQSARGLRASCVHFDGEALYIPVSYFCFVPDEKVILPQYFVLQIRSEYIQKLFGVTSPRRSDFLATKLIVPSLEAQRQAIEDYQAEIVRDLGMEVNSLKTERFNEYERNMHLRKHALKQVMNEVLPAARRIANFISSQGGPFTKETIIAERSQSSLETYAVKLFQNVEKINALISALTEDTQFGEPETIELPMFMAGYCYSKLSERYKINWYGHGTYVHEDSIQSEKKSEVQANDSKQVIKKVPEITAYISPNCLTTILDNIVANAVNHGFTDPDKKDYAIRIEYSNLIEDGKEMVEIRVMNNGDKLSTGVTPERIFTWGVGSGTGLGAWQTKNIVEHFGGTIEFIQYDDEPDGFNVEYRFTLPMSK